MHHMWRVANRLVIYQIFPYWLIIVESCVKPTVTHTHIPKHSDFSTYIPHFSLVLYFVAGQPFLSIQDIERAS